MLRLEILAARDEDQRLLQRRVVRLRAGGVQGVDQEDGVRQIGPAVRAVAGAAVAHARFVVPFVVVPLDFLDERLGLLEQLVVAAVGVRFVEAQIASQVS